MSETPYLSSLKGVLNSKFSQATSAFYEFVKGHDGMLLIFLYIIRWNSESVSKLH